MTNTRGNVGGAGVPDARVPKCDVCGMYDEQARRNAAGKLVGVAQVSRVRVEIGGERRFVGNLCELDRKDLEKALDALPEGEPKRRRRTIESRINPNAPLPAKRPARTAPQKRSKGPSTP